MSRLGLPGQSTGIRRTAGDVVMEGVELIYAKSARPIVRLSAKKYRERAQIDASCQLRWDGTVRQRRIDWNRLYSNIMTRDQTRDGHPSRRRVCRPEWRRRGVAALLVRRAVDEARRLRFPKTLFVDRFDGKGSTLSETGWAEIERLEYADEPSVAMQLDNLITNPFGLLSEAGSSLDAR